MHANAQMQFVIGCAFALCLAAQDARFNVRSELVVVPVNVTSAKGGPVDDLEAADFTLLDKSVLTAKAGSTFVLVPVTGLQTHRKIPHAREPGKRLRYDSPYRPVLPEEVVMFGLMRARTSTQQIAPRFRRLHYCGTCKTLGSLYGQKSRMLLNHDTVFLAEILSLLTGEEQRLSTWSDSYQSFNCLNLPDIEEQLPLSLQYAATATLVLTEYRLRDHVEDSGKRHWRWLSRLFSPAFVKASDRLRTWGFPLAELEAGLARQTAREKAVLSGANQSDAEQTLLWLAEPTAAATASFFAHGARLAGREQCSEAMERLGYLLGVVAYVADAWQDRRKDAERGEFNAIDAVSRAYEGADAALLAQQCIASAAAEMGSLLATLPLPPQAAGLYALRLRANLAGKLPASLPIVAATRACRTRESLAQRWSKARELAADIRQRWSEERGERWAKPVFGAVALLALFSPHQVREAHTAQECAGLGSNLMFWGSLAVPLALCGPGRQLYDEYGRPVRVVRTGGSGCGRDCCCCCEACACETCACEACACEECCSNCC